MYYGNDNYILTWSDGRRLIAVESQGGDEYSFTYNDEGIRTSKTVNGVKHTYVLNGSQIISEQFSNVYLVYVYDDSGAPMAIHYRRTGSAEDVFYTYYLEKNLQGDVVALYNSSGTVLARYTYDAWGNCTTTYYNGGASTGAQFNPFRYRGYYYDSDLGFYYLNSRYYDANTGRFINADGEMSDVGESVLGYNLFAYCFNNPVNMTDPDGNWPSWSTVIKAATIAITAAAVVAAVAATIVTCGATSIATTIVVSSAITIAANATEVAVLQGKKSVCEGKDNGQVATDIIESVFDNGVGTVAKTTAIKTAGYAVGFYSQSPSFKDVMGLQKTDGYNLKILAGAATHEIANRFTNLKYCASATASKGSMLIAYGFAGLNVVNAVISIFADDPAQRATSRGYTLK